MKYHVKQTFLQAVIAALLVAACNCTAVAAEQSAAQRAKTIAPFIDEQTVAVAHVDFTKIYVGPLLEEVGEFVPEAKPYLAAAQAAGTAMLGAVNLAGGKEIYYVVSIADPRGDAQMIFAVMPLGEKSNVDTLSVLIRSAIPRSYTTVQRIGNCLVAGAQTTIERLKTLKPDRRPEIEKAFEAAGDTAIQLLILPPNYFRRIIDEMMPTLPDEIGGGSSKALTDGLLWAAISIDAPPKTALRGVIQSQDQKSAEALLSIWRQAHPLIFGKMGPSRTSPPFRKILAFLMPIVDGDRLVLVLDKENGGIARLVDTVRPIVELARRADEQMAMMNNFMQIAIAMHNHHDDKGSFPAAASHDADGSPLLSWRVHLLPYLEQEPLYKQFHLDEPWDSPHNKKLIAKIPPVYRMLKPDAAKQGMTRCLAPVGENTAFSGKTGLALKEIKGGSTNTIIIVEVAADGAVPWTKPVDLQYDPKNPAKGLGDASADSFVAALCDGSVKRMPKKTDPEKLRKLFDRNR